MINPYTFYCVGFLAALLLYPLGWSKMYPSLEWQFVLFIATTILAHSIASVYWARKKNFKPEISYPDINPLYITIFIYCLWIVEFIYAGGIPLLNILLNVPYDYRLFGVPSLHVFVVTFSSFYTVYLFHLYITQRNRVLLALFIINLLAALLIYNRAMLMFNLAGSFFIYVSTLKQFSLVRSIIALAILPFVFYVFGVLGNIRVSFIAKKSYNSALFLIIGDASDEFRESTIPREFFWSYVYITSPLANLQTNIKSENKPEVNTGRLLELVNSEFLFDFISKRTMRLFHWTPATESGIGGPFNVSTVYSRSYSYCGWVGLSLMSVFILVVPLLYKVMLGNNNPYALTGIAILCSVYMFMIFDNTLRFTGFSFQLVYPVLLPFADRYFKKSA